MRGDFSRRTHDPSKRYSAVLTEQGRLLTDADMEEEHRILADAHERTAADVVGPAGGPLKGAGFHITVQDGDLRVGVGRYVVDGILVENFPAADHGDSTLFQDQPFPTGDTPASLLDGLYPVVLDVWRRLVTALDDPTLREVALGGPTTASREQTVWQVRVLDPVDAVTCTAPPPPTTTGTLAARASAEASVTTPCLVPERAQYTGLENQLYRVEVLRGADEVGTVPEPTALTLPAGTTDQVDVGTAPVPDEGQLVEIVRVGAGGSAGDATFCQVTAVTGTRVSVVPTVPAPGEGESLALRVPTAVAVVSRENGSVVTGIKRIEGRKVVVTDLGPDGTLGFAPHQWVEITDDAVECDSDAPRRLYFVTATDDDEPSLTLATQATPLDPGDTGVVDGRHPKLRRWDGAHAIWATSGPDDWRHLEQGIEVAFGPGRYLRDDHWSFPARTAVIDERSGTIAWPQDGAAPAALPPQGVTRHRAPLAVLEVADGQLEMRSDCRDLFPPLTRLTNLLLVGGDGQEARRHDPGFPTLRDELMVRVVNGGTPVKDAVVRFTADGAVPVDVVTSDEGVATHAWTLVAPPNVTSPVPGPSQTCTAHLLGNDGRPVTGQVVRFTATVQDLTTLLHVSGDGQQARVGDAGFPRLPRPVVVRVANGAHPVEGATVELVASHGAVAPSSVTTGADGIASAVWDLDPAVADVQEVTAVLQEADGTSSPHQRVTFLARVASQGHGGCCTTVGEGGEFATIEAALAALREQGRRDLCLCLLPGNHVVRSVELAEPVHLSIRGCGRTSRVVVEERLDFTGLASLRLADLDLQYPVREEGDSGVLLVTGTPDVRIDDVHVSGRSTASGLVTIHGGRRVHVVDSVVDVAHVRRLRFDDLTDRIFATARTNARRWPALREVAVRFTEVLDTADGPDLGDRSDALAAAIAAVSPAARRRVAEAIRVWGVDTAAPPDVALELGRLADAFEAEVTAPQDLRVLLRATVRLASTQPDFLSELVALEIGPEGVPEKEPSAEVVVRGNLLYGDVSFHGPAGPSTELVDAVQNTFAAAIGNGGQIRGDLGTVHVSGNHLGRLRVSSEILEQVQRFAHGAGREALVVHRSFLIADNVFDGVGDETPLTPVVLGRHVALTGNRFTMAGFSREHGRERVLEVLALAVAVTGNVGELAEDQGGGLATVRLTAARWSDVGNLDLVVV